MEASTSNLAVDIYLVQWCWWVIVNLLFVSERKSYRKNSTTRAQWLDSLTM